MSEGPKGLRSAKLLYPIIRRLAAHPDPLCNRWHAATSRRCLRNRLALKLFCISDPSRHEPILLASSFTLQGVYRSRGASNIDKLSNHLDSAVPESGIYKSRGSIQTVAVRFSNNAVSLELVFRISAASLSEISYVSTDFPTRLKVPKSTPKCGPIRSDTTLCN